LPITEIGSVDEELFDARKTANLRGYPPVVCPTIVSDLSFVPELHR